MSGPELTRPIIGIEYRTPQEVFDIMCDRIRGSAAPQPAPAVGELEALERIAALDPSKDSTEGWNEWGEADCFRQAQAIARAAIEGATT